MYNMYVLSARPSATCCVQKPHFMREGGVMPAKHDASVAFGKVDLVFHRQFVLGILTGRFIQHPDRQGYVMQASGGLTH